MHCQRSTSPSFTSWLLSRFGRLPYCSPVAQIDLCSHPDIYRSLSHCVFLPFVALYLALALLNKSAILWLAKKMSRPFHVDDGRG